MISWARHLFPVGLRTGGTGGRPPLLNKALLFGPCWKRAWSTPSMRPQREAEAQERSSTRGLQVLCSVGQGGVHDNAPPETRARRVA
eukprot:1141517-Pelagomonas_calceolata.AAC.1